MQNGTITTSKARRPFLGLRVDLHIALVVPWPCIAHHSLRTKHWGMSCGVKHSGHDIVVSHIRGLHIMHRGMSYHTFRARRIMRSWLVV